MGARRRPAPGGGHRRPGHPARQGHLISRHEPAPPRRPARGRQPAPGRGPGRDHANLRHPQLDRAKLQTGQRRAGLGRLPGPLRHRDPPPPGPGQRRVQLLLGRPVRRYPAAARPCATAARTRPRRGGHAPPYPRRHHPGRGRCARYAPGSPPRSRSSAPTPRKCRPTAGREGAAVDLTAKRELPARTARKAPRKPVSSHNALVRTYRCSRDRSASRAWGDQR